jgi:hypothetical protein
VGRGVGWGEKHRERERKAPAAPSHRRRATSAVAAVGVVRRQEARERGRRRWPCCRARCRRRRLPAVHALRERDREERERATARMRARVSRGEPAWGFCFPEIEGRPLDLDQRPRSIWAAFGPGGGVDSRPRPRLRPGRGESKRPAGQLGQIRPNWAASLQSGKKKKTGRPGRCALLRAPSWAASDRGPNRWPRPV